MADNKENIGILDNLPDTQETTVPRSTSPEVGTTRDTRDILANLPDQGADPNAILGLRGSPEESAIDSTMRNFLSFGIDPSVYNNVKTDFDHQAKLHPQGNGMLNVTSMKLDARAEQHAADPTIPVIRQGQPLTGWQTARVWFEDQFGITAKRQLEFEAQREGLSPEELADRVGANNVRLDRYLKFDPAAGAAGVLEGVAGGLEWLTDGKIGGDFANQMQILRDVMGPVDPNFLDQVSQGAGSMAMFFIPGLGVGSGVTRIFATAPRVANILGASTMTALESMTEAGLVWRDIFRKTGDREQADKGANATFWLNVPLNYITSRLGIFAEGGNNLGRFLKTAFLGGTQETGQDIIAASQTGEEIRFKDLVTTFGVGAIIEGGAGTITGALQRVEPTTPPIAPPAPLEVAPIDLAVLAKQVDAGTITEDEAIETAIEGIAERLIEPLEGEEVAVRIADDIQALEDTAVSDTITIAGEEVPVTRGAEEAPEGLEPPGAFIDRALQPEPRTAATLAAEAQRRTEIEARTKRAPAISLIELLRTDPVARQGEIERGVELLTEEGQINLQAEVALDVIRDRLSNFTQDPRQGIQDVLNIGRAVFAEGKAQVQDFTARMQEIAGEAWETVKPYIQRAWEILDNEAGQVDLFHGSPFDFDEFSLDAIGTGEGAQAFGWGLYFTDKKAIADFYRNASTRGGKGAKINNQDAIELMQELSRLTTTELARKDKNAFNVAFQKSNAIDLFLRGETKEEVLKLANENFLPETIKWIEDADVKVKGTTVAVTLHKGKTPDQYDYMEWDKDITGEQLSKIKAELPNQEIFNKAEYGNTKPDMLQEFEFAFKTLREKKNSGRDAYRALSEIIGSDKETSLFLLRAGIDGIQYPAGTLSGGGEGTNYVVFDPTAITIESKEAGFIDLNAEISLAPLLEKLRSFAENPEQGAKDMMTLANSVWAEGKTQVKDFMARMKEVLGDLFESLKPHAQKAWNIIVNERGEITIGPEGAPDIDLENRVQAIRTQARSRDLPAFMEDNPTWSEEEVDTALDKAQQGQPITEREAEIVHATLAEAGAQFYQEAVEDEFITLEPAELNQIIEQGIQDFVSKLEVVEPAVLTAEQKKKKERTKEFAQRGREIKKLQDTLRETTRLLHLSVQDQATVRQREKEGTKAAKEDVKRLESKIETRDKRIAEIREKAKTAARALPKPSVKAQVRQVTGLSKAETALVREDVALKEGIRQAVRAAREAFRAGRKEGIAEAETRLQELIDEAKARAKREATGKKIIALTISENLPPGVRGQFVKALAAASTPGQFTKLATRVGDAITKFEEAQALKKNLATQRQKLGFIRKIGEFNQTVITEIKQEVGLTKPLTQATEAQLSEITDRLKARLRFKRSRGFNPQIEQRGTEKPEIQDTVYKANRDISLNQKSEFGRKFTDVKEAAGQTVDKLLGIISSRLADINPKLRTALRKFEFKTMTQIQKDRKAVLPFLEKAGKMSKDDHFDFDLAVKNGDIDKINEMIEKYDMKAEYDKVRSTLDDIYTRANAVGFDIGYQQNYFPRQIKDAKGFLEWFGQREDWSIIQEAIQRKEMALGRVLEFDEKVSLINTMIRGYSGGNITLSETGSMKQRVIDFVSPELNQFYEDSLTTLSNYISQVDEAIGQRVFFGKSRPIDGGAQEFNNLDDSLGFYITDLITQGLISPSQEKELRQILQARFGEKGTSGAIGLYKNLSYLTLLGSPLNAVTQLGDMAFSLYAGGPKNVLTTLPQAIIGKSIISKEDIGIEKIAAEVENKSRVAELVDRVFRITGLIKIDTIGKETLINSVILKYQKLARNEAQDLESFEAFESQMQDIFEDETAELMDDLRNDVISENVKYLAFNELLNFQPIALSEVPEVYLTAGNGRIFYALKTWTLKMLDVYRNEVFRTMKTDKVQGVKNMLRLSAWLVTMNVAADVIKKIMKGEDLDDEDVQWDILVDNLLKLIGFSRYSTFQARRDGIGSAVTDQISPPTNIIDDISKDVVTLWKDPVRSWDINKLRSIKNIPVIGQLYYWWFGRRAEKKRR